MIGLLIIPKYYLILFFKWVKTEFLGTVCLADMWYQPLMRDAEMHEYGA
jgi:hypothetical protein